MNKAAALFLKIAGGLLILFILLQVILSVFGDRYVGNRLKDKIHQSSNGLYSLQYDDLDLGLLGRSVQFQGLQLKADTSAVPDTTASKKRLFRTAIQDLSIGGIGICNYFINDELTVGSITVQSPNLQIQSPRIKTNSTADKKSSFSSFDSTLYGALPSNKKALSVDRIAVTDGQFLIYNRRGGRQDSSVWVSGLSLQFNNISVDSSTVQQNRLFVTDDLSIGFDRFGRHLPGDFYTLSLKKFSLSSTQKSMDADSLQIIPRYPKFEFARQKGVQTDRLNLMVPHVSLREINFGQSINQQKLYAEKGTISRPRLEVFKDKSLPPGPPKTLDEKIFPHVKFKQLDTKIKLDSLAITNGYISYSQQKATLNTPGTVSFENIFAAFYGISNYEADLTNNHIVKLDTRADVMGEAALKAGFSFPMGDNNGRHSVQGSVGQVDVTTFSEATEYMALTRIEEGQLYGMDFNMTLDNFGGTGSLTADYQNLSINMLEADQSNLEDGSDIKSFIANSLVLRETNHEPPLGEAKIKYERTEVKSLFSTWWKSMLSGLKDQMKKL